MKKAKPLQIVLYGAESTGKTSLAKQLAKYYQTSWSKEYLRVYLEQKLAKQSIQEAENIVEYSELEQITRGQIQNEEKAIQQASKLVFFDTNLLMSQIYAEYYFGKSPDFLQKLASSQTYDLYLFLENDIAWEADSQRDSPEVRNKLSLIFKNELSVRNLNFITINGIGKQRFQNAIRQIDKYLNTGL